MQNWKYNESFVSGANEIRSKLDRIIAQKHIEYNKAKQKANRILANLAKTMQI